LPLTARGTRGSKDRQKPRPRRCPLSRRRIQLPPRRTHPLRQLERQRGIHGLVLVSPAFSLEDTMRVRTIILGLALTLAPAGAALGGDGDAFFNGKDLTGWEGLTQYWTVKDGALIGASPDGLKFNTFLCSKKKYGDFELR